MSETAIHTMTLLRKYRVLNRSINHSARGSVVHSRRVSLAWRLLLRRVSRHFHSIGLLLGTLFFAVSLTPSLLPRPDYVQGLISGLSLSAGYGAGVLLYLVWDYFGLPVAQHRVRRLIQLVVTVLFVFVVIVFLWQASGWQNNVRDLMGMEAITGIQMSMIAVIAVTLFLTLLWLFRLFYRTFLFLSKKMQHFVPTRVSHLAGLLSALILFWSIIDGVLFSLALQAADRSYQRIDALIEPEFEPPLETNKTGSATSLISWEQLGRQGRRFVSLAPTRQQIAEYAPLQSIAQTMDPLRVYVGLNSAETAQERADLALAELLRVGAFSRAVLVLITPTGTGWVDPGSIGPLEYLYGGNTASVAAQYSYLSSPLAILSEADYGVETARAMFQTIYGYWSELPADDRPDFYLLGLSLGALNSDLSFDFYDIIEDPFHGALWSGPPFRSETWRSVTQLRDPGSPAWLPKFRHGAVVRFANQSGGLDLPGSDWGAFRIAFLQYASDPITFFAPQVLYREPDWMQGARGPDVTPDLRWFPVVTMLQLAADMASGVSPRGYGHAYAAEHYLDSWVALTEPAGWTSEELGRLRAFFSVQR
ncbi:MAG: alpha/beta-hydrolase family protein [Pseudohongiella sp.]|nr:alpha/beta-hydrolase family protein [Pseudohongiella sp.]MDP2127803.1 alpha/beta-hydrolase family protein [Pseudohongiella sp.]